MSRAYPGTIPMIEYRGGGKYNLFEFNLEVGEEMSWGGVQRLLFLTLQTLLHILFKLHYQLGLFTSFLKICMGLDRFQIGLYLLWHESFCGLDHLIEIRGGQSREGNLLSLRKIET